MPDDDSRLVPLLPIPNRTVKRFCADDSAVASVKVGYCQAMFAKKPPISSMGGFFFTLNPPRFFVRLPALCYEVGLMLSGMMCHSAALALK